MRHLEARGFQDSAKIAKEFPGRVVGAGDFGRRANTTIQVSGIQVSGIQVSGIQVSGIQVSKIQVLRDHSQDSWEFAR